MRILFLLFMLFSCSESELSNFDGPTILSMAKKGDPDLQVVVPKDMATAVINCYEYTPNCRYGYKVKIKNVELKALFYDSQENALKAAKRIKGYLSRNWVFDDVSGEPILERFVVKYLEAKKVE